jgi:aminoglycoside 3-N-acetyltransferase
MSVIASALTERWHALGIQAGDTLLLHSSAKRTLTETGATPAELLQSFTDALGAGGTLVLPLFNFDFCEGVPFHYRDTPSRTGILSELARLDPRAVLSGHPVYRFAAIGKNAERFAVDNRKAFEDSGPFGVLDLLDAKVAALDLDDAHSMTAYHYVESNYPHRVTWRYHKTFGGMYTGPEGESRREYSVFVRNREAGCVTDVNPCGEMLWTTKIYHGERPGVASGLRWCWLRDFYLAVSAVVLAGMGDRLLYKKIPR